MIRLSTEARNLNWLVSNFVAGVPGVTEAAVVSSDGLLIALSDGLDRSSGDRLAAVSAGLLSIAKGGSTPIGGGRVHELLTRHAQGKRRGQAEHDGTAAPGAADGAGPGSDPAAPDAFGRMQEDGR